MTAPTVQGRRQTLFDLFIAAMETGIGSWAELRQYHYSNWDLGRKESVDDLDRFQAKLAPPTDQPGWGVWDGDQDKTELVVDRDVMSLGLDRWLDWLTGDTRNHVGGLVDPDSTWKWQREPYRPDNQYWRRFADDVQNGRWDDVDFDADIADMVVQLALFNEVVFA